MTDNRTLGLLLTAPIIRTKDWPPQISVNNHPEYNSALAKVMSLADFERSSHSPTHSSFHLERMSILLDLLDNPQVGIPTIHVAGTKGKGSTAAMIASILTANGNKTGLYTSPHLHSMTERIRVGRNPIEKTAFATLLNLVWPAAKLVEKKGEYGPVTTFEIITAMAFLYYKQVGVDFQVIEVGLGGRLDATNVVTPMVSVITSISLDHVVPLGKTLALIAAEKAGIIKANVPVIVAPQTIETLEVLIQFSVEKEAPMVQIEKEVSWQVQKADIEGQSINLEGLLNNYRLWTPLLGEHQAENVATAVATVETLKKKGLALSKQSVSDGLKWVRWPGRLEILRDKDPQIVVDGAHNPYSIRKLVKAIEDYFEFQDVILVFGATTGHNALEMIGELTKLRPTFIAVQSRHPKSAPTSNIAAAARDQGLNIAFESDNVGQATRRALKQT